MPLVDTTVDIPFVDLRAQYESIKEEVDTVMADVINVRRVLEEVVMRLLRGEDLESVSRAVGITAARASHWRAQFLAAGQAGLKSRATDARDEDHRRLQAKIGELLMETELLYAKVDQLEASGPLARRRSTR